MKNEVFLDLLKDIKIDDEYIEEALTGSSDTQGSKVYGGKTRISPIKIIAPIAACLAVFAAAGILFSNRDKLPINNNVLSPTSASESTASASSETQIEEEEHIQLLIDKYDVPATVDSLNRSTQYYDIDNDGTNETVIEFESCKQLPGIYVFSSDGRLIGALSHEKEPIDPPVTENDIIKKHERYTPLCARTEDGKNYYYYCTFLQRYREPEGGGSIEVGVWTTYEIVVNEDGTLSTVKALEWGGDIEGDIRDINRVYGVDVSREEFIEEEQKYNPLPHNPYAR